MVGTSRGQVRTARPSTSRSGRQPQVRSEGRTAAERQLLELQRQAGNRAVAQLVQTMHERGGGGDLAVVQRHPGHGGGRGHTHADDSSEESFVASSEESSSEESSVDESSLVESSEEEAEGDSANEDAETIATRTAGIVDNLNSPTSQGMSGSALPLYSSNPTGGTVESNLGSVMNPALSVLTGAAGMGIGAKKHADATKERKKHRAGTGAKGDAKDRKLSRDINSAGADTGQGVANVAGNTLNIAYGTLNNYMSAAQTVAYPIASAAGAVTTPLAVFQMGRYIRKAEKARKRVNALQELVGDETDPLKALAASKERWELISKEYTDIRLEIMQSTDDLKSETKKRARVKLTEGIARLREEEENLRDDFAKAFNDINKQKALSAAMTTALNDAAVEVKRDNSGKITESVSLLMIQAYAFKKNNRGWMKKTITAMGSAVGAAGGVASLVASIALAAGVAAGAGILVATPIGWALGGIAAVIGLGLAGYQSWKFFRKRWKLTEFNAEGEKQAGIDRLGQTLAFWKKVGPSKREAYADALFGMAADDTNKTRQEQAQKTIEALDLDWAKLDMKKDPASSKALIAAKLGS
jgi:hypothetical protein